MYLGYQQSSSDNAYAQPRDSLIHYGHLQKPLRNGRRAGSGLEAGSLSSSSCSSTFLVAAAVVAAAAEVVKLEVQSHFPRRIICN